MSFVCLFVCLLDTALCFYLMFQFLTVLHELHFLLTWFQYLNAANVFLFSLFTKVHPSSNALCCSMMKLNPLYHSIDVFCLLLNNPIFILHSFHQT